jgi:hypothetical protein
LANTNKQAMSTFKTTLYFILICLFAIFFFSGCAPVFSEMQSARTVGQGRVEATPLMSIVGDPNPFGDNKLQNHYGLMGAYGITDNIDVRVRYEMITVDIGDENSVYHVLGIGPKLSIDEDNLAFAMPFGRLLGEGNEDSWQLHPTMLVSAPILFNKIEANFSAKYLMSFCKDCQNLVAANLGLALGHDIDRMAIRPEYGLVFNPSSDGYVSQLSIGLSATFGH